MDIRNLSPIAVESQKLVIQPAHGANAESTEAVCREPLKQKSPARTGEPMIPGQTSRKNPCRAPARNALPRIAVNGEALNLTLDTELRRAENAAFK